MDTNKVHLLSILPHTVAAVWVAPSLNTLRAEPVACPKPVFAVRSGQYVPLLKKLFKAKMIFFSQSVRAVNGLFGVRKPDGSLRLIVDARRANAHFIPPPPVHLTSPETLASVLQGCTTTLFTAKSDLDNYYHRIAIPEWLSQYFALPPVSAQDLGEDVDFPGAATTLLFPCLSTLPMGWAYSVWLAQVAHEWLVYSSGALLPHLRLSAGTTWLPGAVYHIIYIDDVVLFGVDTGLVEAAQAAYVSVVTEAGFCLKSAKLVRATSTPVKCLGFMVDGLHGKLSIHEDTRRSIVLHTYRILRSGRASGRQLQVLLGKWLWVLLPTRLLLSVLSASFRFVGCAGEASFSLWPSVTHELRVLLATLPLLTTDLRLSVCPVGTATDASLHGFGVVVTTLPSTRSVCENLASPLLGEYRQCEGVVPAMATLDNTVQLQDQSNVISGCRWRLGFKGRWHTVEHINVLELRVLELLAKWCMSRPGFIEKKVIFFSDSQVVVAGLRKGRSSAYRLLSIYRRLAAYLLGTGTRLIPFWVRSAANPADAPSRGLPMVDQPCVCEVDLTQVPKGGAVVRRVGEVQWC